MLSYIKGPLFAFLIALPILSASAPVNRVQAAKNNIAAQDPRTGEQEYERSKRLLAAIDEILKDTAKIRHDVRKLPSKYEYSVIAPPWVDTKKHAWQNSAGRR